MPSSLVAWRRRERAISLEQLRRLAELASGDVNVGYAGYRHERDDNVFASASGGPLNPFHGGYDQRGEASANQAACP
jgi:hypothetical protein